LLGPEGSPSTYGFNDQGIDFHLQLRVDTKVSKNGERAERLLTRTTEGPRARLNRQGEILPVNMIET
jgi:hypothetical protein